MAPKRPMWTMASRVAGRDFESLMGFTPVEIGRPVGDPLDAEDCPILAVESYGNRRQRVNRRTLAEALAADFAREFDLVHLAAVDGEALQRPAAAARLGRS